MPDIPMIRLEQIGVWVVCLIFGVVQKGSEALLLKRQLQSMCTVLIPSRCHNSQ